MGDTFDAGKLEKARLLLQVCAETGILHAVIWKELKLLFHPGSSVGFYSGGGGRMPILGC